MVFKKKTHQVPRQPVPKLSIWLITFTTQCHVFYINMINISLTFEWENPNLESQYTSHTSCHHVLPVVKFFKHSLKYNSLLILVKINLVNRKEKDDVDSDAALKGEA